MKFKKNKAFKKEMSRAYNCLKGCCLIKISEPRNTLFFPKRRGQCRKAGVFIFDPEEKMILLVQSRGQLWGAPKGTLEVDRNETSCECAIREVKEETGLDIESKDFSRAIKIKNRAIYYYLEKKYEEVYIQTSLEDNDANGITWIKLNCLEECIKEGNMILNEHCRILIKKFLGKQIPNSDFVKVKRNK